jgi:hypothetical protein
MAPSNRSSSGKRQKRPRPQFVAIHDAAGARLGFRNAAEGTLLALDTCPAVGPFRRVSEMYRFPDGTYCLRVNEDDPQDAWRSQITWTQLTPTEATYWFINHPPSYGVLPAELEEVARRHPPVSPPDADNPPTVEAVDGAGKRPCYSRDHTWLAWSEQGMRPATIRDRWNRDHPAEKIGSGASGYQVVKTALRKARSERYSET